MFLFLCYHKTTKINWNPVIFFGVLFNSISSSGPIKCVMMITMEYFLNFSEKCVYIAILVCTRIRKHIRVFYTKFFYWINNNFSYRVERNIKYCIPRQYSHECNNILVAQILYCCYIKCTRIPIECDEMGLLYNFIKSQIICTSCSIQILVKGFS